MPVVDEYLADMPGRSVDVSTLLFPVVLIPKPVNECFRYRLTYSWIFGDGWRPRQRLSGIPLGKARPDPAPACPAPCLALDNTRQAP